ncbi:hypothetical protein E4U41_001347 [Claviceps citrina]|nr:hypothetical protein E4U41_001347 [Claviceps citrina]
MAATLTIRNLTTQPIQLIHVERFRSDKIKIRHGSLLRNVTSTVASTVTDLLQATQTIRHEVRPTGAPTSSHGVCFRAEPFRTTETDIAVAVAAAAAAAGEEEVLRLTFRTEHGRCYETDVPSPSCRSAVMRSKGREKLAEDDMDADADDADDDAPAPQLTAVHVPGTALLAIFSSARLHAWMHELRDDWPLTMLSIPGTHNSPTCHPALPSVRCQAVPVPEQLQNGVRFLDVRVSASTPATDDDDDAAAHALTLVHSAFPISLTGNRYLSELLDDVYRFLDQNPSEAVLMSLKREGTGKATDGQMGRLLRRAHLDRRPDRWWTEPRVPTLGEVRGRIVLIRRFGLDDDGDDDEDDPAGRGYGLDAHEWPDNCEDGIGGGGGGGGGLLRIQDFYDITESRNIEQKIDLSRRQLERAAEQAFVLAGQPGHDPDARPPPLFVNFLTASNFFNATCWPERIAAKVNPAVIEYLCGRHGEEGRGPLQLGVGCAGTGVVVTDWVGARGDWDLVRCIVGMNAGLQLRQ